MCGNKWFETSGLANVFVQGVGNYGIYILEISVFEILLYLFFLIILSIFFIPFDFRP